MYVLLKGVVERKKWSESETRKVERSVNKIQ